MTATLAMRWSATAAWCALVAACPARQLVQVNADAGSATDASTHDGSGLDAAVVDRAVSDVAAADGASADAAAVDSAGARDAASPDAASGVDVTIAVDDAGGVHPDFAALPANSWLDLGVGWRGGHEVPAVFDQANRLFFKYGGCGDATPPVNISFPVGDPRYPKWLLQHAVGL